MLRQIIWVRRQSVYVMSEPGLIRPQVTGIPIELVDISIDNASRVTEFRSAAVAGHFVAFLRRGQIGVFAVHEGNVVGHAWAECCRDQPIDGCGYLPLEPGEALIHYCNVRPENRGQNIYPAMLVALLHRLFGAEAMTRVFIDTERTNTPSRRGIEKVGFSALGDGTYVQILKRRVYDRVS